VTDNQSQWPAQYPKYGPPDGTEASSDDYAAPAPGYPAPQGGYPTAPNGYPTAPNGYPTAPNGYPVPPGGYPVPPGGYPVPAGSYPAQHVGYQLRAQASMRASSADRERAVDVLKAGFAEGRLSQDEYNDRMGRAYAARTYGELAALTGDLPIGPLPAYPVSAYQPPPAGTNSMAVASMVLGVAEFFTAGLTAIPAVICGHVARRQMKLSGQRGEGLATSGLVLGYMAIIFWSVLIAASLVGVAISIAHNGGPAGPIGGGP
jgi:Domain of unknown function (DUF1707)/Domain of unknown function (DUF4190)